MATTTVQDDVAGLEDYLDAIKRGKWLILLVAVAGMAIAYLYAQSRTDSYEAEARILVGPTPVGQIDDRLVEPNLDRDREVLTSVETARAAADALGGDVRPAQLIADTSVAFQPESDVLRLTYVSTDPDAAAERANAIAEAYVDTRETESIAYYETQIAEIEAFQEEVATALATNQEEINFLNAQRQAASDADDTAAVRSIDDALGEARSLRNSLLNEQRSLEDELRNLQVALRVRPTSAQVLSEATPPSTPTGIADSVLMVGGLVGGLLVGVIIAFALSRLDRSVQTESDVQFALGSPVLATVPKFNLRQTSGSGAVVMASHSSSKRAHRAREEYRRLRSSLRFLQSQNDLRALVVTSTSPGEGKSATTANLGVAMANAGLRTVLVSGDLRRPTLETMMGVRSRYGLADWLASPRGGIDEITHHLPVENLHLIAAGHPPVNPAELLGSELFDALLDELRARYDMVLIDTAPILAAADTLAVVQHTDGVLFVVDARRADLDMLERARRRLDQVGARVVGAVQNRDRHAGGSGYAYTGYYSSRPAATPKTVDATSA